MGVVVDRAAAALRVVRAGRRRSPLVWCQPGVRVRLSWCGGRHNVRALWAVGPEEKESGLVWQVLLCQVACA